MHQIYYLKVHKSISCFNSTAGTMAAEPADISGGSSDEFLLRNSDTCTFRFSSHRHY